MPSKNKLEKLIEKEKLKQQQIDKEQEDKSWEIGVNKKQLMKEKKLQEKQQECMDKNKEMKLLQQEENEQLETMKKNKIKKGKKDHDLKILEEVLKNASKKENKYKQDEIEKKQELMKKNQQEIQKKQELEEKQKQQENDYLKKNMEYNQFEMNNLVIDNSEEENFRSIDDFLNNGLGEKENISFKKFYNNELQRLKIEESELKLSQMKDKILKLWKKSTLNPSNIFKK
tara:strand:- start:172 stop:858 length:687 start_codon:yes stop_codon:yes gene_type:complete